MSATSTPEGLDAFVKERPRLTGLATASLARSPTPRTWYRRRGYGGLPEMPTGWTTRLVLLRFEAGEAMLWVHFDGEGRVSGLRQHPPSS